MGRRRESWIVGVATAKGHVPAEAILVRGGLAITRCGRRWRVTHLESGYGLFEFSRVAQARVALERLLPLADWTRAGSEVERFTEDELMVRRFKAVLDAAYAA